MRAQPTFFFDVCGNDVDGRSDPRVNHRVKPGGDGLSCHDVWGAGVCVHNWMGIASRIESGTATLLAMTWMSVRRLVFRNAGHLMLDPPHVEPTPRKQLVVRASFDHPEIRLFSSSAQGQPAYC
jgi:hypothetical protein